jgi:sarcosine oxidase / L-pipecolate oxidase
MSKQECALYKSLPVLFNIESGFFMEPDEEKRELKFVMSILGIVT